MGLGSSLGAVPGGQPSAPNLNPPSQIDPSSIERAYAALGLTYQGNQMPATPQQSSLPTQGLPGQAGVRPMNPMGMCGGNFWDMHFRMGGRVVGKYSRGLEALNLGGVKLSE